MSTRFAALDRQLARHAQGSGFVSYSSLSRDDARGLATQVDAVAEPLSQVSAVVLR